MSHKILVKKINEQTVKPIKLKSQVDDRPVLGGELFPEPYANITLIARKKSGKTQVCFKILKECAGPNTKVLAFCSTINIDDTWIEIKKYCKRKGIDFQGFDSIIDEKGRDLIKIFCKGLQQRGDEKEMQDFEDEELEELERQREIERAEKKGKLPKPKVGFFDSDGESENDEESESEEEDLYGKLDKPTIQYAKLFNNTELVKQKEKFIAPEYMLFFDDLSDELKKPSIVTLLTKNRHYKCKTIISSHYPNDSLPKALKMCDYMLVFGGFVPKKMEKLRLDTGLPVPESDFLSIYKNATKEPYNFLYIDTLTPSLRKNFNHQYVIQKNDKEEF